MNLLKLYYASIALSSIALPSIVSNVEGLKTMNFDKVTISKITRRFELEALVELGNGFYQEQTLALRGLDLPGHRSKKGQALHRYLVKTIPRLSIYG